MAYAYKGIGDKKKAIEYYKKIIKYGDRNTTKEAKSEIEKLKN